MKHAFRFLIVIALVNARISDHSTSDGNSDGVENSTENLGTSFPGEEVVTKSSGEEVATKSSGEEDNFDAVLQDSRETDINGAGTTSTEINEEYSDLLGSSESALNFPTTSENNAELSAVYLTSSELITTENECEQYDINDVIINATQDTIEMSWDADILRYAGQCKIIYDVNITAAKYDSREIPYFRQELNTHHKFTRLQPCTAYNLSLQANEGRIFQRTVRTLPGEIENLKVTVQNDKTWIAWSSSGKPHCSNYKILLDDRVAVETTKTVNELDGNLFCTAISVVNVDEDDRDGRATTETVPGPIQNLTVVPGENSLNISWDPPVDSSCVTGYLIVLEENSVKINDTYYVIYYLEACTSYTVAVAAVSDTGSESEFVQETKSTIMPAQIGEVSDLTVTKVNDLYINATWGPPFGQGECITSYYLILWNQDSITQSEAHPIDTYYEFTPLVGCMTYYVQVKAMVSEIIEGLPAQSSTSVGPMPLNPPVYRYEILGKTWAQLTFGLDSYSTNMCRVISVNVTCEALKEDNEDLPWLVFTKEESVEFQDSSSRPAAVVNVTDLSEFTNYTCYATATNTWGESPRSKNITFQTNGDVPSEPQNLQIMVLDATSFNVTWEEPFKIPGILTSYHFSIEQRDALHYIPEDCEVVSVRRNLDLDPETTHYLFTEGLPNFYYYVSVVATTESGIGPLAEDYASTFTSVPEVPRNFRYDFESIQGDVYNVTALLKWLLPCNTNGNITHFEMVIQGASFWTGETDERTEIVPVNEPIENVSYDFRVENLKASFNYSVELFAVGAENGEPGESTFLSFVAPEGFPSAPTITNIVPSQNYATITWNPPAQQNGQLINYRISIATDGPLHFIPDSCELTYGNFEYTLPANETTFTFQEGLPNFNYSVTVVASTSTGFGVHSDPWIFQTLPSSSYPPRDLNYALNNVLGEVYNVTVTLNWLFPCNTNSHVTHFVVRISGRSFDDAEDDQRIEAIEVIAPMESLKFPFAILPLQNYTAVVYAFSSSENNITGQASEVTFLSPDGWPSAPAITDVNVASDDVTFTWAEPLNKNGILQHFRIVTQSLGPLHLVPEECDVDLEQRTFVAEADARTFTFKNILPNYNYSVTVAAATGAGYGPASNPSFFQTPESDPEAIRNLTLYEILPEESEIFKANATVSFLRPCNLNGEFRFYKIGIHADRIGFDDVEELVEVDDVEETVFVRNLKPEFTYTINVTVLTKNFSSETTFLESFLSPSGVPPVAVSNIPSPLPNGTTQAIFTFPDNIFDETSGSILYYSLILSGASEIGNVSNFGFWDGTEDTWPSVGYWTETGTIAPYQVTPIRWNPFVNRVSDSYMFVLGEENCTDVESFCNGPLRADTSYALIVRGFTSRGFRNTAYSTFITPSDLEPGLDLALILGLTFGILAALTLAAFIFILWWRRRRKQEYEKNSSDPMMPAAVAVKDFPDYYDDIKENLNKLKSEYTLLETQSAALSLSSDTAIVDENRKKNRYINILPYDDSRVKLDTDKNANYSDYINASYIKGYSGTLEYIATQGPLESTVVDFWRMVMQENVAVIVMVAQFVENGKQKCHKYFPSNHGNMEIGDGIEIRCSNELDFGSYTVRSLLIQRELNQWSITHLQFTDWPDFGCPTGTHSMLQFCNVMRSYIEKNKSKTIVHCSAGVGRTGTLIAVDILLQTIENNANLNVFKTVFNMRKQRSHMVQTEKQYMYILTCIKDHILNPLKTEDHKPEPIYENLDILQTILNNDKSVAESAL